MRDYEEGPYVVYERDRGGVGTFFLGAMIGAGLALLFAPRTGEETQQEIKDRARRFRDTAEEKVREAQRTLEARIDEARGGVESRVATVRDAVESGRDAARQARKDLEQKLEHSKAAYRAGVDAARSEARAGGGGKSGATQATAPSEEDEGE